MELKIQHLSQGTSVFQSISSCLPRLLLRGYKCEHLFVHCHPLTRIHPSLKILIKSPSKVPQKEFFFFKLHIFCAATSEVTQGLILQRFYLLISFSFKCPCLKNLQSFSSLPWQTETCHNTLQILSHPRRILTLLSAEVTFNGRKDLGPHNFQSTELNECM